MKAKKGNFMMKEKNNLAMKKKLFSNEVHKCFLPKFQVKGDLGLTIALEGSETTLRRSPSRHTKKPNKVVHRKTWIFKKK